MGYEVKTLSMLAGRYSSTLSIGKVALIATTPFGFSALVSVLEVVNECVDSR